MPLFIWMGEILLPQQACRKACSRAWRPGWIACRAACCTSNIIGCTIFAAVSGSSAATCATIGKITLPELQKRGYPEKISIGTLAGAGTLGLLIPPSIIMIVYGVAAECLDRASCSSPA